MYNVFRYSGRYLEAAFVRELFDEPTTVLYQVWSLIWTLENAAQPGSTIPEENVRAQADELVLAVVQALDGVQETETVDALLRLRTALEAAADDATATPRRSRTRSRQPRRSWSTWSTTSSASG